MAVTAWQEESTVAGEAAGLLEPMVGVLAVEQAVTAVLAATAAMVMVVEMDSPARDEQTPAQSKSHCPS
eukprot:83311-Prymnesium_polylepis.1